MSTSRSEKQCYVKKIVGKHLTLEWRWQCDHGQYSKLCCRYCLKIKSCSCACARTGLICAFYCTPKQAEKLRFAFLIDSRHDMFNYPERWDKDEKERKRRAKNRGKTID